VSVMPRGDVVRFRVPRTARAARLAFGVSVIVLFVALVRRPDFDVQLGVVTTVLLGGGALTMVLVVADLIRPEGVDLRPDAIVVHGRFRRREIAWADVADVRLDPHAGVVLDLTGGRRVTLGCPGPGLLPPFHVRRFEAGHRLIREWWLDRRAG